MSITVIKGALKALIRGGDGRMDYEGGALEGPNREPCNANAWVFVAQ